MKRSRNERGSASVEAAIGVPAFMLFVGLIIFGGRTATAHQALESAAADAARSASLERSGPPAAGSRDRGPVRPHRHRGRSRPAQDYLEAAGVDGTVSISGGDTITVTVLSVRNVRSS